jgi:uncharacterized protein
MALAQPRTQERTEGALTFSADLVTQPGTYFTLDRNRRVGQEFWDAFRTEIDTEELVRRIIPVYDKHFTQDEIRQLIAFYQTPIGAKFVAELPSLTQESMQIGMEWGQEIATKAVKKIQAQEEKQKS